MGNRALWATASDSELLQQCEIDTYRASGPGGQKRNKTSSAVRLRHRPSGLIVIAEESRSQHENKAKALLRLRSAFYLFLREDTPDEAELSSLMQPLLSPAGRIDLGRRDPRFWPAAGLALDCLEKCKGRLSEAATIMGLNTANLVTFFETNPKLWQHVNQYRSSFGLKPLQPSA
jgi:hypothetical protein